MLGSCRQHWCRRPFLPSTSWFFWVLCLPSRPLLIDGCLLHLGFSTCFRTCPHPSSKKRLQLPTSPAAAGRMGSALASSCARTSTGSSALRLSFPSNHGSGKHDNFGDYRLIFQGPILPFQSSWEEEHVLTPTLHPNPFQRNLERLRQSSGSFGLFPWPSGPCSLAVAFLRFSWFLYMIDLQMDADQ